MYNKLFSIRNLVIITILAAATTFGSCNKALDVKTYSNFTTDNFFSNVTEANMAVLGVYETMSSPDTYGWYLPMVFDNDSDIGQIAGLSADRFRTIPHYLGIPEADIFYTVWSNFYAGIDRANVAIEKIQQMDKFTNGTADEKAQLNKYLGEAKFLRGFYYSELVRLWGDVPFKIKSSQANDNLKGGLTDRYTIYTQIIKDMEEAIDLLPTAKATDERVNKWAAKSVLARVAIFAGGYALQSNGTRSRPANYQDYYKLAQQQINDVMAANIYKLNPDYAQVFKNQCQHKLEADESIFEVAFYNPTGGRANGSWIGVWNAPGTARGVYPTTTNRCLALRPFYESYQNSDQRKDFAIARFSIGADGSRTYLLNARQDETWTPGKWSREYQTGKTEENGYTHINHVIMRYSDLLLLRAEVENELNGGPNAIALDAINQVRRRAYGLDNNTSGVTLSVDPLNPGTGYTAATTLQITGGGGNYASASVAIAAGGLGTITMRNIGQNYSSAPTVTVVSTTGAGAVVTASLIPKPATVDIYVQAGLSQQQFLDTVMSERAKELCFEGMRRADLIRWNKLGSKINETRTALNAIRANYFYPAFTNFTENKHELYPFPLSETDVNKNIGRQNPGY